jgi:hypothetical protein
MDLASTSMAAAGMLNQNVAALQATISAVGQNPTAGGAAAQAQVSLLPQISTSVLKTSLSIEATTGAQLAQMISQGSGVNILA